MNFNRILRAIKSFRFRLKSFDLKKLSRSSNFRKPRLEPHLDNPKQFLFRLSAFMLILTWNTPRETQKVNRKCARMVDRTHLLIAGFVLLVVAVQQGKTWDLLIAAKTENIINHSNST